MSEFYCGLQDAGRAGAKRCSSQCGHCATLAPEEPPSLTAVATYQGGYVDFLKPKSDDIDLIDIATALSHCCRFAGHVTRHVSVAEHALEVADAVFRDSKDAQLALAALHHDSHEAYMGDIPAPLKRALKALSTLEDGETELVAIQGLLDAAIAERFGFPVALFEDPRVKAADLESMFREAATVTLSKGVGPFWNNDVAREPAEYLGTLTAENYKRLFIDAHYQFGGK